ncbi:chromophore lyase CpcT/CpeT [Chryseobacterium sp. SIMBA_038]|uniref:chromophore lyase CpcT/CpeT n=1 Tax=Chryseobacterium sp. SIMBA_038 TaxID=3085780 RepID=UPI00397A18BC
MKKNIFFLAVFATFACSGQIKKNKNSAYLNELVSTMQGTYSSAKQATVDSTYFNISLKMIPIWEDRGNYLYVEQALTDKQDKPYRVRIYKITQRNENEFVSEIYTLRNEKDWIGKWNDPLAFEKLYENELDPKHGCEVVLKRIEKNKFSGQTGIKTCASELRGATYATSKVLVSTDQILSWDQGFDKDGKQVWGAVKSGYIFEK